VNTHNHSDLIDTTEMYLRTIYELEEEGVTPLRARIAERLNQSGPTVSQTVARMERDGLVTVESDRHLALSGEGRKLATSVMRKHRLAERHLQKLGLEWEQLHIEACRWEHVMSDAVERRILATLDKPLVCPHGNPIPGLEELGLPFGEADDESVYPTLLSCAGVGSTDFRVERIGEHLQPDADLMKRFSDLGVTPGHTIHASRSGRGVVITNESESAEIDHTTAEGIFVSVPA
jgi:DtxR family transcriptional regulator, Mn-dependent transcriptional regulator